MLHAKSLAHRCTAALGSCAGVKRPADMQCTLAASACNSSCCAVLAGLQKATVKRCLNWLGFLEHVLVMYCKGVTPRLTDFEVDGASVQR